MSNKDRPKCMHCGNPADYICANCGKYAICEDEEDDYCPKCGEENGFWTEI
ncbi:MAG: hypothetical protein ACFFAU_07840 [Candidatus Hodarchaeota archaeon]